MSPADECRKNADDCRQQAERCRNPLDKERGLNCGRLAEAGAQAADVGARERERTERLQVVL